MATISACLIVKNEERVLAECLNSIKQWVDQIIIIDTGSSDATPKIAQELGAQVIAFKWDDDFAAARNYSLDQAKSDWILWLDADHILPTESAKELRDLIDTAPQEVGGFIITIKNPSVTNPGEAIIDKVKLLRNNPSFRFEGRIHEQIEPSIVRAGFEIRPSPLYVVHSGYDFSPAGQQFKMQRDSTILQKQIRDNPSDAFSWFNLGMTYYRGGDSQKTAQAMEHFFELESHLTSVSHIAYSNWAESLIDLGNVKEAIKVVNRALDILPDNHSVLYSVGVVYAQAGEFEIARDYFLSLFKLPADTLPVGFNTAVLLYIAPTNLANIYMGLDQPKKASYYAKIALKNNPEFQPAQELMAYLTAHSVV